MSDAILQFKKTFVLDLVCSGHESLKGPDNDVLFRIRFIFVGQKHLYPRDDEKRSEHIHHPVKLQKSRTERDKRCSKYQRAENAIEQNTVLVFSRDVKVLEHEYKDKD